MTTYYIIEGTGDYNAADFDPTNLGFTGLSTLHENQAQLLCELHYENMINGEGDCECDTCAEGWQTTDPMSYFCSIVTTMNPQEALTQIRNH